MAKNRLSDIYCNKDKIYLIAFLINKYTEMENSVNMSVFSIGVLFLVSSLISVQSFHVGAVEFAPVPFDRIPVARVSTDNGEYNLTADFSIDLGDEAVAIKNNDTVYVNNMTLNMEDSELSFGVECDSNDECGTGLSPTAIKIYLFDSLNKQKS